MNIILSVLLAAVLAAFAYRMGRYASRQALGLALAVSWFVAVLALLALFVSRSL